MEIGKQIKKYRSEMKVSQEELGEQIFVSRQTISNWENDKNYPDLKSLLLLSSLFGVSLDILIKGDIEQMKEEIKSEDIKYVKRNSRICSILFLSLMVLFFPLVALPITIFGFSIIVCIPLGIYVLLDVIYLFFFYRFFKIKKNFDLKSHKEIVAFFEGKTLSEFDKQRIREESYYKKLNNAFIALFLLIIAASVVFVYFRLFA